jgi:thiamine kinase
VTADRGPLLGEGREAEIFSWGDSQALRLLRDPGAGDQLDHEVAAMRAADQAGVPVPAVDAVITIDGRPGLVMERVFGTDLLTELATRPWRFRRRARQLGALQARLHRTQAPSGVPAVRDQLRARIQLAPHLADRARTPALELLERLPDGEALCHGDFHPGNVLVSSRGPVIIDWVAVGRGDPVGDLARTMLLLRVATRPGLSAVAQALDNVGRRWFRTTWRRAYQRKHPVDPVAFERWTTVHAASRLCDGFEEEVAPLLALVDAGTTASC